MDAKPLKSPSGGSNYAQISCESFALQTSKLSPYVVLYSLLHSIVFFFFTTSRLCYPSYAVTAQPAYRAQIRVQEAIMCLRCNIIDDKAFTPAAVAAMAAATAATDM